MYKNNNVGAGPVSAQEGITLIALVITIIVMLILVGVTISMSVNGGLFEKAGQAVGDTRNAIDAEKKLGDGKIKIGDKWYASIDDYINNNPITTGIKVNLEELTLKKNEEGAEGEEVLTGTITANIFGMEEEPEITWKAIPEDQTAITLSNTTGKSVTVTAVGTENTEVTLTAKCTYEGKEYTATSKVTLEIMEKVEVTVAKGAFVEYGVEYTDVYIAKDYTTTNGWRLLHYDTDENGNLYNVELISTGVPGILYYYYDYSTDWRVTDKATQFKTDLQNYFGDGTSSYTFFSSTGNNVYVASGMYYNFENIPFYTNTNFTNLSSNVNAGYYDGIKVNGIDVTENTNGSIFLTSSDFSARMLTLPEINNDRSISTTITSTTSISSTDEPAAGLYVLHNLDDVGLDGCSYSEYSDGFWLASPWVGNSSPGYYDYYKNALFISSFDGSILNTDCGFKGVRPVVSLGEDVRYSVDSGTDETTELTYLILTPVN